MVHYYGMSSGPLTEVAWGEVVPRDDFPLYDDPSFAIGLSAVPHSRLYDREDGRCLPWYETEYDLSVLRGQARQLPRLTPVSVGALESLRNYTIGLGFEFAASSDDESLAAVAQSLLDEFLDDNAFRAGLDWEIHDRSREDGEVFVLLESRGGHVIARCVEPDSVTQPANHRAIEDWLGEEGGSWSFGVHSIERRGQHEVRGFHCVFDGAGNDWDYIHASHMLHVTRNVPRSAKRGVSDYAVVLADLVREAKLRSNTAQGAAIQAAIAFIREHPAGTTSSSASGMITSAATASRTQTTYSGGSRTVYQQRFAPGTILDVRAGQQYKPGPMGAERNGNFLLVGQYVLRAIGVRWAMPEYMISGDASNANYSSTLVAESPFVKAREADQEFYRQQFSALVWKVWRLQHAAGRFGPVPWEQVESAIELDITPPRVATRNETEMLAVARGKIELGILSRETAAAQLGEDFAAEVEKGAAAITAGAPAADAGVGAAPVADASVPTASAPAAAGDAAAESGVLQGTALNGAQISSLLTITQQIAAKQLPPEAGRAVIAASFPLLTVQQIDAIIRPLAGFEPPAAVESQPVAEAVVDRVIEKLWESYP